ncbi:hypothetical protein LTR08_000761 [Meristemomyces frigidus]|nr:hypothetical protein LTR08_000761 [Meristemomyces frigidus]
MASQVSEKKSTFTTLVTGANSGLGFAICCRLIDEFLATRPQTQTLQLLFSTRDKRKGDATLHRLNAYFQKALREANGRTLGISRLLEARVKIEGVLVDLTELLTVKRLAEQLLSREERLDVVIWNAGITGYAGLNWPKAVWHMCTDLIHATTYPTYALPDIGLAAKWQLRGLRSTDQATAGSADEPKLGQVFLANVFGHYMLTHWLAPLFTPSSRVIWISSISATPPTFDIEDLQCLRSETAYEGSKRLTDMLVLTSELPSAAPYVSTLLDTPREAVKPKMYVTHPGVIVTSIAGLHWFISFFMVCTMHVVRLFGSPWHPVSPYKGAVSAAFVALAPPDQLSDLEARDGKGKWGSAISVYNDERVARTEVGGWGFGGKIGKVPAGSVTGTKGRYRGLQDTNEVSRQQFEEDGRRLWREMEELRVEWEERLESASLENIGKF